MTPDAAMRFFMGRPFEPFVLILSNGRELQVQHPEHGAMGRYGHVAVIFHPSRQVEVIDIEHIVSIRTLYPSTDLNTWTE